MGYTNRVLACISATGIVLLLVVSSLALVPSPVRAALTPVWASEPDIGSARTQAVVVNDEDGMVYVMGGVRSISGGAYGNVVGDAASYDPETGVWTTLANMPFGVRGAAGAYYDGSIYVFGGINVSFIATTQIYSIEADSWSIGAPMPLPTWEAKAVAVSGSVWVAGGEQSGGSSYATDVWIYDIETGSWAVGPSLPVGTKAGGMATDGYKIFYIGGTTSGLMATSVVFMTYYWSSSWEVAAPLPRPVSALAAVCGADGMIYALGGGSWHLNVGGGYADAYVLNPDNNTWMTAPDMTTPARYLGAAATPDGRVLAIGGNDATTVFDRVESMQVVRITAAAAPSTVPAGRPFLVSVTVDFAFALPEYFWVGVVLKGPADTAYPVLQYSVVSSGTFAAEMSVPQLAPAGSYTVWIYSIEVSYVTGGGTDLKGPEVPLTVVASMTLDEQIAYLNERIAELEAALAAGNANVTAIQAQLAALQTVLGAMAAGQQSAMDDLNDTLAELQDRLDAFKEQIDRVETKADDANTWGMVNIALVIVVLALVALMVAMAFKKKA